MDPMEYTPGQIIATRAGQRLIFESSVDGVDYGHIEDENGAHPTQTVMAAVARGYWKPTDGA